MNSWTIDLAYPRPPKGLSANDRVHWRTRARSTQQVRGDVVLAAVACRIPAMQRMEVALTWHVPDRRKRDPDNIFPLLKVVCDALGSDRGHSARLVTDDSPEYMTKRHPTIEYTPGVAGYFRVRVTELGADPQTKETEVFR